MNKDKIFSEIKRIIVESADIPEEEINENSLFMDDLELSSLEVLDLIAHLEEVFQICFSEKELRKIIQHFLLQQLLPEHRRLFRPHPW